MSTRVITLIFFFTLLSTWKSLIYWWRVTGLLTYRPIQCIYRLFSRLWKCDCYLVTGTNEMESKSRQCYFTICWGVITVSVCSQVNCSPCCLHNIDTPAGPPASTYTPTHSHPTGDYSLRECCFTARAAWLGKIRLLSVLFYFLLLSPPTTHKKADLQLRRTPAVFLNHRTGVIILKCIITTEHK